MVSFAWLVLALAFVDEVLAVVAYATWGWHLGHFLLVWSLPLAAVLMWWQFAARRAPHGGPMVTPIVKLLYFAGACWALYDTGHPRLALAMLVLSVLVALAGRIPPVKRFSDDLH